MSVIPPRTRCRALVAGFGRPGMRDLDIGRQLARYLEGLRWDEGVVVEDLSYAAPMALHRLQELEPAKVVLVGAAARGFAVPGSVRRYRLHGDAPRAEDVQRSLEASVQGLVDIDHTLAVARHYGALPADTVLIEVEPADCSFGPGFSEDLATVFDAIVTLVREELGYSEEELLVRDLEPDLAPTTDRAEEPSAEPTAELEALIGYARDHEESRAISRHRGRHVAAPDSDGGRLDAAGRSVPWGVSLPRGGSDWFDVVPVGEGWWGCLVGDVPGRGVEATAAMADLRAAVRAYAVSDGRSPRRVLERLDGLARATGLGAEAALVYIAFQPDTGELRISNAGGCTPLVWDSDGDARFVREAVGHRVGEPPTGRRPEVHLTMGATSTILLFTDGLVDVPPGCTTSGLDRLQHAVMRAPTGLDDLCDHILTVCTSDGRRDDDLCLLALRAAEPHR